MAGTKQERFIAATTLNALAKSAVFLFVSFGISISLAILKLQSTKLAELADTSGAIILTIGVGYFFYWLSEIPSAWFVSVAKKTESKLDDMMAPVIRKSLRVSIVILVLVQIAQILSDKPITFDSGDKCSIFNLFLGFRHRNIWETRPMFPKWWMDQYNKSWLRTM